MSKIFTVGLLAPLLACGSVVWPHAYVSAASSGTVIAQKSAKKGSQTVTVFAGLQAGHSYRIEAVSTGRYKVSALAHEDYTFVSSKQLVQNMKPFTFSGKTPVRYGIKPPTPQRLRGWTLSIEVQISSKHPLTVRVRDLGKTK